MRYLLIDPRLSLHPKVFKLSDGEYREYMEGWCFLADHPELDWIPARFVTPKYARVLVSEALWAQDGAIYRVLEDTESGENIPELPRIVDGFDSKALDLAPKSKSSKALVLQDTEVGTFERFWNAFGLKTGKKDAMVAWKKAIKIVHPEAIIERAAEYRHWLENHPSPPQQKYAQGWLNGRRWEDELGPYPNNGQVVTRKRDDYAGRSLREAARDA